jgi:nicotinate phosphoribosyltransferase
MINTFAPIITSILDSDFYTLTVGQVAFKEFPLAKVKYRFINRSKTIFPAGFEAELRKQLAYMSELKLTDAEYEWLDSLNIFSQDYLQFLKNYRFDPAEVRISSVNGSLEVEFYGSWERLIMWEVPFLALISELCYKMRGAVKEEDWKFRIHDKARAMSNAGCSWMEFGTRRRFDFEAQNEVVSAMCKYKGFIGTSNMLLAMRHGINVRGTMSHQGPMAMQAKYGAANANKEWRKVWIKTYKDKFLIFLPDTYTTDVFLRDFNRHEAELWNLRQDSGNPDVWMQKILGFYKESDIDSTKKTVVLSDNLNARRAIEYFNRYRNWVNMTFGIGTNFTNDCGHTPLSIVIKLIEADFGNGMVPVVKLSDDTGKNTGDSDIITQTRRELNLV